jgi:hypothetical protein
MSKAQELKSQIAKLQEELDGLEPWEPKRDKIYWYIAGTGEVCESPWDNIIDDRNRRDFLGIFKTFAQALARRDAVKGFVEGLRV